MAGNKKKAEKKVNLLVGVREDINKLQGIAAVKRDFAVIHRILVGIVEHLDPEVLSGKEEETPEE